MPDRLRLLWVTPNLPRLGVAAARERIWHLLARIARRHDVTLLTLLDPEDADRLDERPPGLAGFATIPRTKSLPDDPLALLPQVVRWGYADPAYRAAVATHLAAQPWDVVQLEYTEMAQVVPPTPLPTVLTVHQIGVASHAARWRAEGGGAVRGALAAYRRLRDLDFELRALARADHVVTMSEEDARRLRRFVPDLAVTVSPVGVDVATFAPHAVAAAPPVDLLFVGNFEHPPNVDAVRWLVRDVLPRVGRPVALRVVGRNATPELRALARAGTVDVVGAVDDTRPHLAAARVVVAPVRFGTGMRGKVLEALAMARPLVTTSLGAEGLAAAPGRELLVADDAPAFAAAIRATLDDPAAAARRGAAGRALAVARYDWSLVADAHEAVYEAVRGRRPARRRVPADRSATVARVVAPLGRPAAVAAGAALLAWRGLRWRLAAPRRRAAARVPSAAPARQHA